MGRIIFSPLYIYAAAREIFGKKVLTNQYSYVIIRIQIKKGTDNMIIHDNRKERTTNFGDIKCGETFYDSYEDIHAMKIQTCVDEEEEMRCNAVALANGILLSYEDEEQVVPTKARIEIYE